MDGNKRSIVVATVRTRVAEPEWHSIPNKPRHVHCLFEQLRRRYRHLGAKGNIPPMAIVPCD